MRWAPGLRYRAAAALAGTALAMGLIFGAAAGCRKPVQGQEGKAMKKTAIGNAIVTMETGSGAAVPPPAAKELGKAKDRAWYSVPWADVLAPANAGLKWDLAYLDEADFLRATQGLDAAGVAEVMAKRAGERDQFIPDMSDLLGYEAGLLGAYEQAAIAKAGPAEKAGLAKRRDLALEISQEAYFTMRSLNGTVEDVVNILSMRNGLETLEGELAASSDCPSPWLTQLKAREPAKDTALLRLAQAASALGETRLGQGHMEDNNARVVFYMQPHPAVAVRVRSLELAAEQLPQGMLVPLTPSELKQYGTFGRPIVVFLNAGEWPRAKRLLTPAQHALLIDRIRGQGGPDAKAYLAEILRMRLEILAQLGKFLKDAPSSLMSPQVRGLLDSVLAGETDALGIEAEWQSGPSDRAAETERISRLAAKTAVLKLFADKAGEIETADWAKQALALADSLEAVP